MILENMSEFNFKSSVCTSIEQSERLLALGLKKETADISWSNVLNDGNREWMLIPLPIGAYTDTEIPAWSLGRLWELYWSNKVVSDCLFSCGKYMNPYAKLIAMIEYDIEDGLFNKDYLDK